MHAVHRRKVAHNDERPAVRQPGGLREARARIEQHGPPTRTIRVHQPAVLLPRSIRDERDQPTVGREPRLDVEARARIVRQIDGLAASRREQVDAAEQIEREFGADGRGSHEGPFLRVELDDTRLAAYLRYPTRPMGAAAPPRHGAHRL
jgi:hypothetical protein